MKIRKVGPMVVAILVPTLLFALLLALAGSAGADQPEAPSNSPSDPVPHLINYQGRLLGDTGAPIKGSVDITFSIYDNPSGGSLIWGPETHNDVQVADGYFDVLLGESIPLSQNYFIGDDSIYLEVVVNGEALSPRQRIASVAYAIVANTLVPGAEIEGEPAAWDGGVLRTNMTGFYPSGKAMWGSTATGSAVYGEATTGDGLRGYSETGYAVYGYDGGTDQARGYAGYFYSLNGVGVYGYSAALPTLNNALAPGVYGKSLNGMGVYGASTTAAAVLGSTTGGIGLQGVSSNNYGVDGYTTNSYGGHFYSDQGVGLYAQSAGSKIYDYGAEIHSDMGYGLYVQSEQNMAVRGEAGDVSGASQPTGPVGVAGIGEARGVYGSSDNGHGVYGHSTNSHGVYGQGGTGSGDYGGYFTGYRGVYADGSTSYGLYTPDSIYVGGKIDLVGTVDPLIGERFQVDPDANFEAGDLLVIDPDSPHLQLSAEPNDTRVIGVVGPEVDIQNGELMVIVFGFQGAQPQPDEGGNVPPRSMVLVKADATYGSIRRGDLLTTSPTPGHAMKAQPVKIGEIEIYRPGTIIGKALESLESGRGLIPVFVALQ